MTSTGRSTHEPSAGPVGIIAGSGMLPLLAARAAADSGYEPVVVALDNDQLGEFHKLGAKAGHFGVGQIKKIVQYLVSNGVKQAVFAGKVDKRILFSRLRLDLRAIKLLSGLKDNKDTTIMLAAIAELERDGIMVVPQTVLFARYVAERRVYTRKKPTKAQEKDFKFGFDAAKRLAGLDIGQVVVVRNSVIVAVEAVEGTDAAIARGGDLAGGKNTAVAVKTGRPNQDPRFDIPVVGEGTIAAMVRHGVGAIALEAGNTFLVEPEKVVRIADKHGIAVAGI